MGSEMCIRDRVKVKEILTKDPGMLEVLNKGWSGAHLPVQRGHDLILPDSISLMILEKNNIRCDDMDLP